MRGKRKYERHELEELAGDDGFQIEAVCEGIPVRLIDFSVGGMFVIAEDSFHVGETVKLSVAIGKRSAITLMGKIARVRPEGSKWGTGIDFTIA